MKKASRKLFDGNSFRFSIPIGPTCSSLQAQTLLVNLLRSAEGERPDCASIRHVIHTTPTSAHIAVVCVQGTLPDGEPRSAESKVLCALMMEAWQRHRHNLKRRTGLPPGRPRKTNKETP